MSIMTQCKWSAARFSCNMIFFFRPFLDFWFSQFVSLASVRILQCRNSTSWKWFNHSEFVSSLPFFCLETGADGETEGRAHYCVIMFKTKTELIFQVSSIRLEYVQYYKIVTNQDPLCVLCHVGFRIHNFWAWSLTKVRSLEEPVSPSEDINSSLDRSLTWGPSWAPDPATCEY